MPIKKAAYKDLRQTKKRTKRNLKSKRNIKDLTKTSLKKIEGKEQDAIKKVQEAYKAIDKACQKGILKKNTAARKKSRLMKQLNKINKPTK